MALPNFISGIFGVTEPAIYGILLPLKTPFVISCIAGGIGGAFYGALNFRKFMMGGMGIFEFPAMIEPDGGMGNLVVAVSGVALTMVIGFVGTMLFYREPETAAKGPGKGAGGKGAAEEHAGTGKNRMAEGADRKEDARGKDTADMRKVEIASPMKGKVLKLESIRDEAFASGVLGKGAAILPEKGEVYAPGAGVVSALFPTLHALGLTLDEGAEVLIHIGLDTVQLGGQGFEALVSQGDRVEKGQLLIRFDKAFLEEKGYCLETPVLITNVDAYLDVVETSADQVTPGENLLSLLL